MKVGDLSYMTHLGTRTNSFDHLTYPFHCSSTCLRIISLSPRSSFSTWTINTCAKLDKKKKVAICIVFDVIHTNTWRAQTRTSQLSIIRYLTTKTSQWSYMARTPQKPRIRLIISFIWLISPSLNFNKYVSSFSRPVDSFQIKKI